MEEIFFPGPLNQALWYEHGKERYALEFIFILKDNLGDIFKTQYFNVNKLFTVIYAKT